MLPEGKGQSDQGKAEEKGAAHDQARATDSLGDFLGALRPWCEGGGRVAGCFRHPGMAIDYHPQSLREGDPTLTGQVFCIAQNCRHAFMKEKFPPRATRHLAVKVTVKVAQKGFQTPPRLWNAYAKFTREIRDGHHGAGMVPPTSCEGAGNLAKGAVTFAVS